MGLLAPVLAMPDGIPSPAAALAALPPWQAGGSPAGNPLLRDVTFQIQPWLLFARREMRAGRLPWWNPYQSSGAPFWANGQSAPLFPLHLLFDLLPLQLGFVLLPWLRLMIGGCGVWLLARELGLRPQAALLAAVTFPLSGMLVSFALFPMGNALALVPWVLWAVERVAVAADRRAIGRRRPEASPEPPELPGGLGSPAPLGGSLASPRSPAPPAWLGLSPVVVLAAVVGLQLLGGHAETSAHTALLTLLYLAVRGSARPVATWLGWAGGWVAGAALAAVQLVPLALVLPETARWQAQASGVEPPFGLLLAQPLRLVLPEIYGHPARGTWWGPFNYSATAVYAGALALPLAAAGLARCRRDRRWLALAVSVGFAFMAAYHWPGVRDALAAVPVLGRAAHHRLIFAVELGLALFAAAGWEEWLAGRGRGALAGAAAVLAMLGVAWALDRGAWAAHGLLPTETAWTAAAAAAAMLTALSLRLGRERRWRLAPWLPAVVVCDLLLAHGAINPALPLGRLYPPTGAVRFLQGKPGRVAGVDDALRPNAAMVYGLYDPRGDDPVKLASYEAIYAQFAAGDPVYFQPIARWDSPWLDRLAVRWVVAEPPGRPIPAAAAAWRPAYAGSDARVYERPSALPLVRWAPDAGILAAPHPQHPQPLQELQSRRSPLDPRSLLDPRSPRNPRGLRSPQGAGAAEASATLGAAAGAAEASTKLSAAAGAAEPENRSAGGVPALPPTDSDLAVLRREPGRWDIAWRTAAPRTLVVAETWERGWASSGGDRQPFRDVAPTDGLLGVQVGPGAGTATLRYRPSGLAAGAAISLAVLAGLAGMAGMAGMAALGGVTSAAHWHQLRGLAGLRMRLRLARAAPGLGVCRPRVASSPAGNPAGPERRRPNWVAGPVAHMAGGDRPAGAGRGAT
jgi:hypothetical protein